MKRLGYIFLVITFGIVSSGFGTTQELPDCSSPEKAVESLQAAVKSQDGHALWYVMFKFQPSPSAEEFIASLKKSNWWTQNYMIFLKEASITRVGPIKEGDIPSVKVWLKWETGKQIGYVYCGKQGDEWKIVFPQEGEELTYPIYDLSTPINAFQSLRQAVRLKDTAAIFSATSDSLKVDLKIKDYENVIKHKEMEREWPHIDLWYDVNSLQEEMLEPKGGKPHCRVWKLDKEGKRVGFELFIKEGAEWKWIPKSKYIWYPAKE